MSRSNLSNTIQPQRGMTLIVGLIMVLLMTIVGMAAIRGSNMQELMAGNLRDRNLAFQAAEAGLREAESELEALALPTFDNTGAYVTAMEGATSASFWDDYWASNENGYKQEDIGLEMVSQQPQFVIEEVVTTSTALAEGGSIDYANELESEGSVFYRVTSRGFGGTEDAQVILQSTFKD